MAEGDFKDVSRITAFDRILYYKAFNIAKYPKYDGLIKKTFSGAIKNENISNKELAEELQKLIGRKFNKRNVHSSFIDNIWGADLADMQLINKFREGIHCLLCVIDILIFKYAWMFPSKDKNVIKNTNAFQKIFSKNLIANHTKYG